MPYVHADEQIKPETCCCGLSLPTAITTYGLIITTTYFVIAYFYWFWSKASVKVSTTSATISSVTGRSKKVMVSVARATSNRRRERQGRVDK